MTELRPAATMQGRPPLLEREHELGALEGVLTARARGARGLVLIEGPAGIGKSRLIAELREHAGRGPGCASSPRTAATSSASSRSASCGSCSSRRSPTRPSASASWRAPRRPRGRCSRSPARRGRRWRRRVVRGAARPVLADGQPRRRAAAAAGRGRPALVRPAVAAVPGLPCAPARGRGRAARGRPADGRAGHRSRADRRARRRPGRAARCTPARSARRAWRS